MTTSNEHPAAGVDHVAYVTSKPEETVGFYRDILGFPLAHCILAKGWGNDGFPDFAHFFFDIGRGARLAFFYYFGEPPQEDHTPALMQRARHLSIRVETADELESYRKRLEAADYPMRHGGRFVPHEMIESLYVFDPNGYNIEFSRPLRPVQPADLADSELSIQALIDVAREPEPTLEKLWARKAAILESEPVGSGS